MSQNRPRSGVTATRSHVWACCGDRLFDGDQVQHGYAVMVQDGLIADIVPDRNVPGEMPRMSVPGGTIMPGLMDTHVHFGRWQGPLYLAYGVTTVRDVGNDLAWILAQRSEAQRRPWPHIVCVGPMLDGPQPYWGTCRGCADEPAASRAVSETAAAGVDGIKFYPGLRTEWLPSMLAEVRKTGLPVMMHCADLLAACEAGVEETFHLDGLLAAVWPEHPPGWLELWGHPEFPRDQARLDAVADRIAASGSIVTPTLFYWDFARTIRRPDPLPPESAAIPPRNLAWLRAFRGHRVDPVAAQTWDKALRRAQEFVVLLVERGVTILPGTDEPWGVLPPGLSLWRELMLLVECGLSPIAALRTATAGAAARLRMSRRGRLLPGYAADLTIVVGDPTVTMTDRPQIAFVVKDGTVHRPDDLRQASTAFVATLDAEPWGINFREKAG